MINIKLVFFKSNTGNIIKSISSDTAQASVVEPDGAKADLSEATNNTIVSDEDYDEDDDSDYETEPVPSRSGPSPNHRRGGSRPRRRRHTHLPKRKRRYRPPVLMVAGEKVCAEVCNTYTIVNTAWQDASEQNEVPSTELYPVIHLDELEFFPGDFVLDKRGKHLFYSYFTLKEEIFLLPLKCYILRKKFLRLKAFL